MEFTGNEQDRKKLEELYRLYSRDLFITAYSILKDYYEAEDAVQTAILRASRNLGKIQETGCRKTRSYLLIIVRNICYDLYNEKKKTEYLPFDDMDEFEKGLDTEKCFLRIEESGDIAKDLEKLHQPYSDILALRYYHELSIGEIADILGITEDNTSVRIHRALKALKIYLNERGDEYAVK